MKVGLTISYKNSIGTVTMSGTMRYDIRITAIEGLGLCNREYSVVTYNGCDGQETLSARTLARTITMAVELCCENALVRLREILEILNCPGYLFVDNGSVCRKIQCNQVVFTEEQQVLKGKILKLAFQFICDSPYFEDAKKTDIALYERTKLLESPFSLPSAFGGLILGANVFVSGQMNPEPVLTLCCPSGTAETSCVLIKNETNGAFIRLEYTPCRNDVITIDVKKRKIVSSVSGNIIGYLSHDTFLGDFVLEKGINVISVNPENVTSDFTASCRYSNLYYEAVSL